MEIVALILCPLFCCYCNAFLIFDPSCARSFLILIRSMALFLHCVAVNSFPPLFFSKDFPSLLKSCCLVSIALAY